MKRPLFALASCLCVLVGLSPPVHARPAQAGPAHASPAPHAPPGDVGAVVDRLLPAQLSENRIPGAAVVVVKDGRPVFAKGYGVADVGERTPVDPRRTGFFTGSLVKAFTATAVLQLVRAGRLDLDRDVNDYLTGFEIEDTYPGKPVTLRHLLTYTAGFDENMLGVAVRDPEDSPSLRESVAERRPKRVRPPGTRVAYDNYGLALAGRLVEIAAERPFAEYVDRHVLRPAGMSGTTVAVPHPPALDARLAKGYRPSGDGHIAEDGQYGPWTPSGTGPVTTPADMGRYMIALLGDDPAIGGAAVTGPLRTRQYTQDDRMPGMSFTFEERPRNGHPRWYKDGDVPGFHNVMALMPGQKAGVYVVYNGDGADGNALGLAQQVMDAVTDHYTGPAKPLPAAGRTGDASRYEGTYRSNRTSHSDLTRFNSLVSHVTVSAGEKEGTLTTSGVSMDPAESTQHWVQTEPGLFVEKGGQDRLAFDGGTLVTTANPAESYERLAWYDQPMLHLSLLAVGALAFLLAFLALPVTALARVLGRRPAHPVPARLTRAAAWLAGALVTGFLTGMATVMSDGNAVMEAVALGSPKLTALPWAATASLAATAAFAVGVVAAWRKGWWGLPGRISLTLLALAAVPFHGLCIAYNVLYLLP